jgi:hypothetical protein
MWVNSFAVPASKSPAVAMLSPYILQGKLFLGVVAKICDDTKIQVF